VKNYLEIFSESYQRVLKTTIDGQDFFEAFYRAFIASSDEVADKFRDVEMGQQRAHLRRSLDHMIYFSIDRKASDELFKTAKVHGKSGKNIRPALYEAWLDSLLETVRVYDPACDVEAEIAWQVVLAPGITYMKTHFNRT